MRPVAHDWITPDWPAPEPVRALVTTRNGGVSAAPFASMNVASHVGDDPDAVRRNRRHLRQFVPAEPAWLNQVHGIVVAEADEVMNDTQADASVTRSPGVVCAVMTADCLPVLLCDARGQVVAAAHAGWRGLLNGVIEEAVDAMHAAPQDVLCWLGPAIGPSAFEVGEDVRALFVADLAEAQQAFQPHGEGKWLADLYMLARLRLQRKGVDRIYGGGRCTFHEGERFYSFRRDKTTGRMASMIWLEP